MKKNHIKIGIRGIPTKIVKDKPGLNRKKISAFIFIALLLFSMFMMQIGTVSAIDIYEPDDTPMTSTPIPTDGTSQNHDFHIAGDTDWVNFTVVSGTLYTIETLNLGVLCDTKITLYQTDGFMVITSDNNSGVDKASRIVWNSTGYPAGYYYVQIEDVANGSGLDYTYDIRIFTGPPALHEPPYSDFGLDIYGDGYFNYLVVNVTVNVTKPGWYLVNGSLYSDLSWIVRTSNYTYLDAGLQIVQLYFNGTRIYTNGINETFDVFFYLYDDFGSFLDNDTYTTGFYNYFLFQPPDAFFQPPHSDFGMDTDMDTLYDYLIVNVTVNVTKPGWYIINGSLYSDLSWIVSTSNYTYLDAGLQIVQLYFNGTRIYTNGINDAFDVFFYLYDDFGSFLDNDTCTTGFYNYFLFQPPDAFFQPPHSDFGMDTDMDTLYDYLIVNITVKVTKAGWYELEGNLYGDSGWITGNTSYTYLDAGLQIVQLCFNGTRIYTNGINDAFDVFFYLYDDFGSFLDNDTCTTGFYNYFLFQPPDAFFQPPHSHFGMDTDMDTLYDYLIVNATINVTKAGWYELDGNLYGDSGWIASNTNYTYLDAGLQFVQLYFNGFHIYNISVNETFDVYFYLYDDYGTFLDNDTYTTDSSTDVLDIDAPWIISTIPMDGAVDVGVTLGTIAIEFSEPMNKSSVEGAFSIYPAKYIKDYTWDGNTLIIAFSSELEYGIKYTMTVGEGAKDEAGNALEAPFTWSFTTEGKAEEGISPMLFVLPIVILVIVAQLIPLLKRKKGKPAELLKEEPGSEGDKEEDKEEELETPPPPPPEEEPVSEEDIEEDTEKELESPPPPPPEEEPGSEGDKEEDKEEELETPPPPPPEE